jgi:hypothetical protein
VVQTTGSLKKNDASPGGATEDFPTRHFRRPSTGLMRVWCGIRWFRCASPPAKFRQASGFLNRKDFQNLLRTTNGGVVRDGYALMIWLRMA